MTHTLTGRDVGEAQGALDALLEDALSASGVSLEDYLILRILAGQGPGTAPRALYEFLVGQPQLGLDMARAVGAVRALENRGLISGATPDGPGPVVLTDTGSGLNATLAAAVAPISEQVFADIDRVDLETAHRVLREVIDRARTLRGTR